MVTPDIPNRITIEDQFIVKQVQCLMSRPVIGQFNTMINKRSKDFGLILLIEGHSTPEP